MDLLTSVLADSSTAQDISPADESTKPDAVTPSNTSLIMNFIAAVTGAPGSHELKLRQETSYRSNRHYSKMKKVIDLFVSSTLSKGVLGLCQEFNHLSKMQRPESIDYRYWTANKSSNRYNDILCLDKTRIVLETHPDNKDYIHANYVSSMLSEKRWICAQAPLPSTVYDFWLMVIEQNSMAVLQLCKFTENKVQKCAVYYPTEAGEEVFYREIRIKCVSVELLGTPGRVVQRVFNVFRNDTGKDVYHLSVEHWPDHGVPVSDVTILNVLQKVRTSLTMPIVVHCSAGIGRTGTIVAIENVLENLMFGKEISTYDIVVKMRQQRAHSVQRESQYLMINRMVLEYFIQVNQLTKTPAVAEFFEEYEKVVNPMKGNAQAPSSHG